MVLLKALVSVVALYYTSQAASLQLDYMQNLLSQLELSKSRRTIRSVKGSPSAGGDSAPVLVATSIEAVRKQEKGVDLAFELGRRYDFEFSLPVERESVDIQKSEIILFPNISDSPVPPTLFVDLAATNSLGSPVGRLSYRWATSDRCASLDVTHLVKDLLRSYSIGVEAPLTVDFTFHRDATHKNSQSTGACAVSKKRSDDSGAPIMITKYFSRGKRESPITPQESGTKNQEPNLATLLGNTSKENQDCNLATLLVNTSVVFGPDVVLPTLLDIGNCVGSCESGDNTKYSLNALVKMKMRSLDPDRSDLKRAYGVYCVPSSFMPKALIISRKNTLNIVEFQDLVVQSCACR